MPPEALRLGRSCCSRPRRSTRRLGAPWRIARQAPKLATSPEPQGRVQARRRALRREGPYLAAGCPRSGLGASAWTLRDHPRATGAVLEAVVGRRLLGAAGALVGAAVEARAGGDRLRLDAAGALVGAAVEARAGRQRLLHAVGPSGGGVEAAVVDRPDRRGGAGVAAELVVVVGDDHNGGTERDHGRQCDGEERLDALEV